MTGGRGRANISLGEEERESAADARGGPELDFSAEEIGQLAADGQAETGSAVLAAGACIGLLEGLEDDALFLRSDADAGVGDLERDNRAGAGKDGVVGAPAAGNRR